MDGLIENTSGVENDLDDNDPICKAWYIQKFNELSEKVDISLFYMLNVNVDRLRRIWEEWKYFSLEEQEVLGEANPDQPYWMQCFAIAPEYDDTNIPDNLVPPMDPNIDWLHIF